tara:strand:- start:25 stop:459 length:435 start_codon:yes stop_codon:yes gene_type:complete
MYALVNYLGNQLLIKEGEQIKIPFLDKKIGTKLSFDNILYINDGKTKKVGSPYIKSTSIDAKIISHGKEKKIIVFKKKRRKGYQKKNGHQQKFTMIQVDKLLKAGSKTKTTTAAKKTTAKKANSKSKTTTTAKKTTAKKAEKKG